MFTEAQLGNPHAKVWVVSSQPKKGEKSPMSSQNNNWFMQFVYAHELTVEDIRFEYLVNDVNRKGGLEVYDASGRLEDGINELKGRIEKYRPNVVLCLGADCLQHLLGQRDVSKWRGHLMPLPFCPQVKSIFTYDPVQAHRQRFVHHTQYPGQYRTLMQFDIRKAISSRHEKELGHYEMDLTICTHYEPTVRILEDMLANSRIISFDIEVIKPYEGRLMDCLSIGDERNTNLCIPLWSPKGDPKKKKTWDIERVWNNEMEMSHILLLVKKLMESPIPKVAQNSQYDITSLEYHYDITVNNLTWDTMVAAHCIFCELPKDLGTLISLFTNIPYHKYLIHSASLADRWAYSAADAGANLHVMAGQIKEMVVELDGLKDPLYENPLDYIFMPNAGGSKLYQHYRETVHPMIRHCVDMHKQGVRIDPELRVRMLKLEREYQGGLKDAIHVAWPIKLSGVKDGHNVNPKSPQQLQHLFYDLLECKPTLDKGKRTMNDIARDNIMKKDKRKEVKLLCQAIDSYIYSDAALLKFKVPPERRQDGQEYLRTKYEPAGTDTGRLASKASDVIGAGTNLQNCEKGPQREMFIPEEGEEFIHVDLYAAEAYLNFLDAGELEGLKMISGLLPEQEGKYPTEMLGDIRVMTKEVSDNLKIHNWMGEQVNTYYPEEAKEAGFKYKHAKQLIHALNYNVQPNMMARESGLPRPVCQWVFNMYHAKFPGIQDRMRRIQRGVRTTTSMETSLKRRRYFFADVNDKLFNVCYAWPNQSTIGEVTNRAMSNLRTWSEVDGRPLCLPVMNTHDGLICRRRLSEDRDAAIRMVLLAFSQRLVLRGLTIRIPVSIGFGPNFNDNFGEKVYFYQLEV